MTVRYSTVGTFRGIPGMIPRTYRISIYLPTRSIHPPHAAPQEFLIFVSSSTSTASHYFYKTHQLRILGNKKWRILTFFQDTASIQHVYPMVSCWSFRPGYAAAYDDDFFLVPWYILEYAGPLFRILGHVHSIRILGYRNTCGGITLMYWYLSPINQNVLIFVPKNQNVLIFVLFSTRTPNVTHPRGLGDSLTAATGKSVYTILYVVVP